MQTDNLMTNSVSISSILVPMYQEVDFDRFPCVAAAIWGKGLRKRTHGS